MSLQDALLQKSLHGLRKTEIEHDASAPKLGKQFAESVADFKQYQESVMDINLEEWVDLISEHTFPTEMMPITPEDAHLFVDSYLELEAQMDRASAKDERDAKLEAARNFRPSESILKRAVKLEERLQAVIEKVQGGDKSASVFVKTSCRSPKDAPTSQGKLLEVFQALVVADADRSENAKIAHLLRAGLEVMRVREARDAVALLTSSRRIWQDMLLALEHKERWNQHIVVRQWQEIAVDMEFRCFVHGATLTAISQYNSLCHFPRVVAEQAELRQLLVDFFEREVRGRLAAKFSDYVVDLAVVEQGGQRRVMVIELNPFVPTTDAACFDWVRDKDLLEGRAAPEEGCVMRVTEAPLLGAKALMEDTWRALLERAPQ